MSSSILNFPDNGNEQNDIDQIVKGILTEHEPDINPLATDHQNEWWREKKAPVGIAKKELSAILEGEELLEKNSSGTGEKTPEERLLEETPEFLLDESLSDQRKKYFGRLKTILTRRFSLNVIADILQNHDYEHIDEAMKLREEIFDAITKFAEKSGGKLKMFTDFKKTVGENNSGLYSWQERVMEAALDTLYSGRYFWDDRHFVDEDRISYRVQDVIAKAIDTVNFNSACEIETYYLIVELTRIEKIIEELENRAELEQTLNDIRTLKGIISQRKDGLETIHRLMRARDLNGIDTSEGHEI